MFSANSFKLSFFLSSLNLKGTGHRRGEPEAHENTDLKLERVQLTVLQERFSPAYALFKPSISPLFRHFTSHWYIWCLVEHISSKVLLILLIWELILAVSTTDSIVQTKNLSLTIVSSLSLKPHIFQILPWTVSLHGASPLHLPASWSFWHRRAHF